MSEAIIEKIKKLNAKAESCRAVGSEAEAQAFAEAVSRLLVQHKLQMTDIDWEIRHKSEPVDQGVLDWAKHEMSNKSVRCAWSEQLCGIIAKAHQCAILVMPGTNQIVIVGKQSDREVAEFVMVTLCRSAEKIADAEYVRYFYECKDAGDVTRARGFRPAFLTGFIQRIGERYNEIRRQQDGDTSMALVRVRQDEREVSDYLKNYGKASALTRRRVSCSEGIKRGRNVANSMKLDGSGAVGTHVRGHLS